MPRLADRAAGTLGNLTPKAVDALTVAGFAAAGVVAVVAENLRTLTDRDQALPERAKKVGQNSIGALLGGPHALTERGRSLVSRGGDGDGRGGERPRPTEAGGTGTSAAAAPDRDAVPPRGIDTSAPEAAPDTGKPASREQRGEAGAGRQEATERKEAAKEAARKAADRTKSAADRAANATGDTARKAADTTKSVADRTRDRAEEVLDAPARGAASRTSPAERASTPAKQTGTSAKKQQTGTSAKTGTAGKKATTDRTSGERTEDQGPDVPEGVDEGLVADLQRMTVKQLRERAAQDGVAGRSNMSKDELVTALATRETDEAPAKG